MIRTDSEYLQYALKNYDNPLMQSVSEFENDLRRVIYINNLLTRYRNDSDDLKDRLLLNHIVIVGNCFGVSSSIEMLYYKIDSENIKYLETALFYIGWIQTAKTELDFELLNKFEQL
jgi:hypothetical protein